MAIRPTCDKCGKELSEFGGILLGPPDSDNNVRKFHLCTDYYADIAKDLKDQ